MKDKEKIEIIFKQWEEELEINRHKLVVFIADIDRQFNRIKELKKNIQ